MDTDHQVIKHSNSQRTFTKKLRRSKALIPSMAVMGVAVMALAAALVVNNSEPQPGGTEVSAKAEPQKEKTLAKAPVSTVERAPVVVARAPKAAICATCGTVESVVAVQRQGQVNGVAVGHHGGHWHRGWVA